MSSAILISLADHLWQSTLFAVAAGVSTLLLRTNSARVRYLLWLAASAKFLVPFALLTALGARIPWSPGPLHGTEPSFLAFAGQVVAPITLLGGHGASGFAQIAHAGNEGAAIAIALGVIWAIGTLVVTARWLARWRHVRRTLRESRETTVTFVVPVRSSRGRWEPGIVGVLRPVLVLPHGVEQRLNSAEMRAVLAHERCHVVWRDNLAAALHMLVEALFWFHPLIWWIGARLVSERERACDERVLAEGHSRETYAEGILKVCEHYLQVPLPCVSAVGGRNLRERIETILRNRVVERLSGGRKLAIALAALATITVPIAVGVLTASPVRAQGRDRDTVEPRLRNVSIRLAPDQYVTLNFRRGGKISYPTLRWLIADTYGVADSQVVGSDLSVEPGYEITADSLPVSPIPGDDPRYAVLLRALLAKDYDLVVRPERRQMDGYVLRVSPDGSKLVRKASSRPGMRITSRFVEATSMPLSTLVTVLRHLLGAPVVDQTGVQGRSDYKVMWQQPLSDAAPDPASVAKALQEDLGLQLEAKRVTVDVIDVVRLKSPVRLAHEERNGDGGRLAARH